MEITQKMKQMGVIVMGKGINLRAWIEDARRKEFAVKLEEGFVSLWK